MKAVYLALLLSFSFVVAAAQEPAQQSEVIRTKTELVQTAVTVLDKKGNFVDGLQREQFELVVDGKPRQVAFFERIAAGSTRERELAVSGAGVNSNASLPPSPATVPGRTIVFFIDDLHLEPDSLHRTRLMLQHFLDQDMSSRDNVAIVSASGEIGFLEQFTRNRAVLEAAIARLLPRQYDASGYGVGSSTKMTEYMALNIDTNKGDDKVMRFYIEECMKGAPTFKKAQAALALIRASWQTHVLRDGRLVLSSPQRRMSDGDDPQRIALGEELALKTLAPGRYDLKVTITDGVAGTSASQIADFIVR